MKKYVLTGLMVVLFAVHLIYQRSGALSNAQLTTALNNTPATTQNITKDNLPNPTPVSSIITPPTTKTQTPVSTGIYKDGIYTGTRADAYYGFIQIQAIIQNGKLSDVKFLEFPNDQSESRNINGRALPILKSEAISAQSANIATVSRATDSSQAFYQSLASALAQAKA